MKKTLLGILALVAVATACQPEKIEREKESLTPVTFEKVALEDNFWLPRLKTQKETLVPYSLGKVEHAVRNLQKVIDYRNGKKVEGRFEGPYFVASDLFKVMEGAAYLLILEKDEKLEAQMDEIIDVIAAAQDEDGYLYECHMLPENHAVQGQFLCHETHLTDVHIQSAPVQLTESSWYILRHYWFDI